MAKETRVWITLEEDIFTGKIEKQEHIDSYAAIEYAHDTIASHPKNTVYALSVVKISND